MAGTLFVQLQTDVQEQTCCSGSLLLLSGSSACCQSYGEHSSHLHVIRAAAECVLLHGGRQPSWWPVRFYSSYVFLKGRKLMSMMCLSPCRYRHLLKMCSLMFLIINLMFASQHRKVNGCQLNSTSSLKPKRNLLPFSQKHICEDLMNNNVTTSRYTTYTSVPFKS